MGFAYAIQSEKFTSIQDYAAYNAQTMHYPGLSKTVPSDSFFYGTLSQLERTTSRRGKLVDFRPKARQRFSPNNCIGQRKYMQNCKSFCTGHKPEHTAYYFQWQRN